MGKSDHQGSDRQDATDLSERLALEEESVKEIEAQQPLRYRVLSLLAGEELTPTVIADRLGVARESVSRVLTPLHEEKLVEVREVFGDRRQRSYVLTPEGELQLSRHRAFGPPREMPASPSQEEKGRFLWAALARAVDMRRQTNQRDDAIARLEIVVEQARKAKLHELVLEGMAELATTLRQNQQTSQQTAQLGDLMNSFDRIALGKDPNSDAKLVLPAIAHREYALGRLGEKRNDDLEGRAGHLHSAATLYTQLVKTPSYGTASGWKERLAWSTISWSRNLREQSDLDKALEKAIDALKLFDELDDAYGRSHCLFMFGFCLRLLGSFDSAHKFLEEAYQLAVEQSFERFQADSLMQLGDVERCRGDVESAREKLWESVERASHMNLPVTRAFALSALGAVEYQVRSLDESQEALRNARELFILCRHQTGIALNARREAIVARARSEARTGESLGQAEWLLKAALSRYHQLHSPAGVAACEVERGWLCIMRQTSPDETVETLIGLLDDTPQRFFLELDPWVPQVIDAFAREVNHDALKQRAKDLRWAARTQLRIHIREGMQRLEEVMGQVEAGLSRDPDYEVVDEMGGEARQRQRARTEPPALAGQ